MDSDEQPIRATLKNKNFKEPQYSTSKKYGALSRYSFPKSVFAAKAANFRRPFIVSYN